MEKRLVELGITLPAAAKPAANYLSYTVNNGVAYISGQLPAEAGALKYTGKVGSDVTVEEAQAAARLCGLHLLAQVKDACGGDWSRLKQFLKLGVFVNGKVGFTEAHVVANGVSDLLVDVLGDKGRHARAAVSVADLPLNAAVEVDAVVALNE